MSTTSSSLYQRAFSSSPLYGNDAYSASAYTTWQPPVAQAEPTVILGAHDGTQGDLSNGQTTSVTTPLLFGTGTPGETLHLWATAVDSTGLMLTGYPLGEAVVQADGTWQFSVPQVPQSALYDFQASSSQGQSSNFRLNISDVPATEPVHHETVLIGATDHVGPVTGELHNGASTDDTRPTFHGTGNPGELINISAVAIGADGKAGSNVVILLGNALVQPDGTWQFTPVHALGEGTYDFYAGQGTTGTALRLDIDKSSGNWQPVEPQPEPQPEPHPLPVTATITGAIDHVSPVTGELANGATTDDTRPTFHGTGTPGDLLNVSAIAVDANGHPTSNVTMILGTALVQQDGTWQFTPVHALGEGTYNFHIGHGPADGEAFHLVIDKGPLPTSDGTEQLIGPQGWELDMATFNLPINESPATGKTALPLWTSMLETSESVLPFANASTHTGAQEQHYAPADFRPAYFDELAQHVVI
ncbi:Ig-like domain-containing protein [Pseudomonas sp. YH-1]|uniref:Ig-like domain-containing protein n=1 Tax=Pseudomonas sp. YH-1 TaxID=3384787 RepID=UPI003F7E0140